MNTTDRAAERNLHMKLERAADALIRSARIVLKDDKWPTQSTVPCKKIERLAEIMNQLHRPVKIKGKR